MKKIKKIPDIPAEGFYKKLPKDLQKTIIEYIRLVQKYDAYGDGLSLRDYKRLMELDSELAIITLNIQQDEIIQVPKNNNFLILNLGGLYIDGINHDQNSQYIEIPTCEDDPLIWNFNLENELFEFELPRKEDRYFRDKYDRVEDFLEKFLDLFGLKDQLQVELEDEE
jgi:hypothetical protein